MKYGVHAQLGLADIGATADTTMTAGIWNRLGSYSVGITEQVELGYGDFIGLENALGRARTELKTVTSGAVWDGELKAVLEDAQGNTLVPLLMNMTLDNLNQGATDITKRMPLPICGVIANRERRIVFYVKPSVTAELDVSASKMILSVTRYSL